VKQPDSKERYICIHGHFYQPPRENAWLETIERQDSAYPYHDWNERITAECYATNAASRVLDDQDHILRIENNYARISFNFGPTLLSWLEQHSTETYRAILDADVKSRERFDGHGSALAQAYNHMIMPLANQRDKRCQVLWGIRDFRHRFGREPAGMWLPETAVDLETLEVLAEQGIRYTVLEPGQARRVRRKDGGRWREVPAGSVDPTTPYELRLPSRRSIALFFYDGPISRGVAFERLLDNGERFASRLVGVFNDQRTWPQLVHIATDGETYGHHHRHGEMALSYALEYIEAQGLAKLTNYGAFLEQHPPEHLVEINEDSSWSCAHGIERWRSDCGCNTGAQAGWTQAWRGPLREALDWLRDRLAPLYENHPQQLLKEPWEARENYIDVILDSSPENRERFLERHASKKLSHEERVTVWKLLEMQRHAMLMYTSCGWFFNDISGIETVQVIQYAGRAMQLAQELFGDHIEENFLARLEKCRSNIPEQGNGRDIYERDVRPSIVSLSRVGAHYAVSLPFLSHPARTRVYSFEIVRSEDRMLKQGRARLVMGRIGVRSFVTEESADLSYGVLHFGDHNLSAGVREFQGAGAFRAMLDEVTATFTEADLPDTLRILDKHFGGLTYSLRSLFRDARRYIIGRLLESTIESVSSMQRQLYEEHVPLMRFLASLRIPLPGPLRVVGEQHLNRALEEAIEIEPLDIELVRRLLRAAQRENIALDSAGLGFALQKTLERDVAHLGSDDADLSRLEHLTAAVRMVASLPLDVDLWNVENLYYRMMNEWLPELRQEDDADSSNWVEHFSALGEALGIKV